MKKIIFPILAMLVLCLGIANAVWINTWTDDGEIDHLGNAIIDGDLLSSHGYTNHNWLGFNTLDVGQYGYYNIDGTSSLMLNLSQGAYSFPIDSGSKYNKVKIKTNFSMTDNYAYGQLNVLFNATSIDGTSNHNYIGFAVGGGSDNIKFVHQINGSSGNCNEFDTGIIVNMTSSDASLSPNYVEEFSYDDTTGNMTLEIGEISISCYSTSNFELGFGSVSLGGDLEYGAGQFYAVNNLLDFIEVYVETTYPSISYLTNSTTTNETTDISWVTDENTNYTATLGICPSYTDVESFESSLNSSFTLIQVDELLKTTNYCFNVTVYNSQSNSTSADFSFTTKDSPDQIAPVINFTSISNVLPVYNETIYISAYCSDETELFRIYYSNNATGVWQNVSYANITGNSYNYSVSVLNKGIAGTEIGNQFTCIDSSIFENSVQSDVITFNLINTFVPETPSLLQRYTSEYNFADARVYKKSATSNFGTSYLHIARGNQFPIFTDNAGRTYISVKMTNITRNDYVNISLILSDYSAIGSSDISGIRMYYYSEMINESKITWNNQICNIVINSSCQFISNQHERVFTGAILGSYLKFDITSMVNNELQYGNGNFTIVLVSNSNEALNPPLTIYSASKELNNGTNQPTFDIWSYDCIWSCSSYGTCIDGSQECESVSGNIPICNMTFYIGNYSEFRQSCVIPSTPPETLGIQVAFEETGVGLGNFLESIRSPLTNIIVVISFVGVIIAIIGTVVYAVLRAVKRKI